MDTIPREGFGNPSRFEYPSAKPRTSGNVKLMQDAEKNLAGFWEIFDRNFQTVSGKAVDTFRKYSHVSKCNCIATSTTTDWLSEI